MQTLNVNNGDKLDIIMGKSNSNSGSRNNLGDDYEEEKLE